jgi:2-polyprenyl-6-methoxyphenol hydroxylase-like FAD-dependent oxidoreductase
MGVTKAAEDAMAMADSIAAHGATPQALRAFEQLRRPAGQAAVQRARRLGAYMQSHAQPGATADSIERDAREVMMETAIDLSPVPA